MAGDVEVGGNGSMHWRAKHDDDVIATDNKGKAIGKDKKGGGYITVEVEYASSADAAAALPAAPLGKKIVLSVKANTGVIADPAKVPAQVRVLWGNKSEAVGSISREIRQERRDKR